MVSARLSLVTVLAVVFALSALPACETTAASSCDCPTTPPTCDGCPPIADELCIENACTAKATADADITADVSIQRGLDGVVAVTLAVIDGRGIACADVGSLQAQANILAGGRLDVSGGPFHPDQPFGLVPAGPVLLAAEGLDADGAVVGSGCVAGTVVAGDNKLDVVTVAP